MKNQVSPPHICYIITRGDWGGAQRYVFDLVSSFVDQAHISIIIGGTDIDDLSKTIKKNVPKAKIYHIPSLARNIHPIKDIAALRALRDTLRDLQPDIIHLNSTKVGILGTFAAKVVPHARLVYTVHGWIMNEQHTGIKKWLYTAAERYTAPEKDAFIVLSESEKRLGTKTLHIPTDRLHVIPNGIDPSMPKQQHPDLHATMYDKKNAGRTLYLTIANFYHTKGLDILIEAIATVKKNNAHFYIAGDGPLRSSIEAQIAQKGLTDQVTLLGSIPDAATLCTTADYLILPSRKEGLPYVLLEALRAGTPIIATDVGAVRETIAGIPGCHIMPPNDTAVLAAAIRNSLTSKESVHPTLPRINTLEAMTQATWSLYQSLLHQ